MKVNFPIEQREWQSICITCDQKQMALLSGMVQWLHIRLPLGKTEPTIFHQDLQQVLPIGKRDALLRTHIPLFRLGQQRLHWLQRIPSCHQHHLKWKPAAETGLGFQVSGSAKIVRLSKTKISTWTIPINHYKGFGRCYCYGWTT